MKGNYKDLRIIAGNSNPKLAKEIADILGCPITKTVVTSFSDGETSVNIRESIRGSDVFVIQSTCKPVNDNLMELLIIIDALKRASAGRINAVIPYYGYARQDRKAKARDPITAKLVADIISAAGADRVLTIDLHAIQIQGFFNIPVDHLLGVPLIAEHLKKKDIKDLVVVAPDLGSVTRSRNLAERLHAPLAIIDKRRPKANISEVMTVIGDIKDKNVVLIDDIIDTAGTIANSAQALKDLGAKSIFASCTHPVLSGPAIERINKSPIDELVITNTIPLPEEKKSDKIECISVAPLFASAINRIYEGLSVSRLFD
ncbi:MAG TPA: ribose-phosphate pyrophosphokinase [Eubacteriaceae bacterium]|jgi:ribose-phosphate pyrophosphokinase|nr:ribose-phosphate pyrophosphokinase [Eubacteriaceae bacterium]